MGDKVYYKWLGGQGLVEMYLTVEPNLSFLISAAVSLSILYPCSLFLYLGFKPLNKSLGVEVAFETAGAFRVALVCLWFWGDLPISFTEATFQADRVSVKSRDETILAAELIIVTHLTKEMKSECL